MTDIPGYLEQKKAFIELELDKHLPFTNQRPVILHEAIRHSMQAGGKRLRPILCLAAAESLGLTDEDALWPALALEAFHTYTLIHDDLPAMDDDDLRRGQPTCHKAYGEANAILAGDALLTLAFEWMANHDPEPPYITADYIHELSKVGGHAGVIAGQIEDLAAEGTTPNQETLDYIHRHKTGVLLESSVRLGAMCGGANSDSLEAYATYGRHIGLAFQIVDDILDVTSSETELGKDIGSDQERGKTTFVSIHGLAASKSLAEKEIAAAKEALSQLSANVEVLKGLADFIIERTH